MTKRTHNFKPYKGVLLNVQENTPERTVADHFKPYKGVLLNVLKKNPAYLVNPISNPIREYF